MAHEHTVLDTDLHFRINPDTRMLERDASTEEHVIQFDHNSERLSFELQREVDGHDMSLCNVVQVHYLNTGNSSKDASSGVYEVDDLKASDDGTTVTCSWLLSANATKYVGTLRFVVRFACVTNGVVEYAWHTGIHTGLKVGEGMNNGDEVMEENADIIEQWRARLFADIDASVQGYINSGAITAEEVGAAPAGYGLGTTVEKNITLRELDSTSENGWYWLNASGTTLNGFYFNYAFVFVHGAAGGHVVQEVRPLDSNIVFRRYAYGGVFSEWECENPPMELGVEYRTTERFAGKPVYIKTVNIGVLPSTGSTYIQGVLPENIGVISIDGYCEASDGDVRPLLSMVDKVWTMPTSGYIGVSVSEDASAFAAVVIVKYTKD